VWGRQPASSVARTWTVWRERLALPITLSTLTIFGLTWLFPSYYTHHPSPAPRDLIAFEQDTGALGTTSWGEYLPVWVQRLPPAASRALLYAQAGDTMTIPRLDAASLPAGAQVTQTQYSFTRTTMSIESPTAFTAVFNWYFFPGWRARLDGHALELHPTGEHGLVSAHIPAGSHQLTIWFGETPLRLAADVVSVACFTILMVILVAGVPGQSKSAPHRSHPTRTSPPQLLGAGLAALALVMLKTAYLDVHDNLFQRSRFDGQTVAGVQTPLQVNFEHRLALIGSDLRSTDAPADGAFDLTLYWRALQPLDTNYSIAVHLIDERGIRYGQKDSQHPGGLPTTRWPLDAYARDPHPVAVWPGTPPGEYMLTVSVYDITTAHSLSSLTATGAPASRTYHLATVRVTPSTRTPAPEDLPAMQRIHHDLSGDLRLLGFDPPPREANAGNRLTLTLYWQATQHPAVDYGARLSLATAESRFTPGRVEYPTSAWTTGEIVRDVQSLLIPAATADGAYPLKLDLLDPSGAPLENGIDLMTITVHAPERTFVLPPVQHPLSVTLGAQATLLGYDLERGPLAPGQMFTLTLYWRAEATATRDHVAFVHLLDANAHIHTQSDRPPANGARPTTGWLPGEIITDAYLLTVAADAPPGRYSLKVGMYDPMTGARLLAADNKDHILLPVPIEVQ
jgi:hypothetical protein